MWCAPECCAWSAALLGGSCHEAAEGGPGEAVGGEAFPYRQGPAVGGGAESAAGQCPKIRVGIGGEGDQVVHHRRAEASGRWDEMTGLRVPAFHHGLPERGECPVAADPAERQGGPAAYPVGLAVQPGCQGGHGRRFLKEPERLAGTLADHRIGILQQGADQRNGPAEAESGTGEHRPPHTAVPDISASAHRRPGPTLASPNRTIRLSSLAQTMTSCVQRPETTPDRAAQAHG